MTHFFPPGVGPGGITRWKLSGENLGSIDRLVVSGPGVEVIAIEKISERELCAQVRLAAGAVEGYREVRADGPNGLSDPWVVRLDHLAQMEEAEPNDRPDLANALPRGSAAVGILSVRDLDHFRFSARRGERMTIEVEARRLGMPIAPVVTLFDASGRALHQGREARGTAGDCRFLMTFPADGDYVVEVRDNLFGGGDAVAYRLRVDAAPFATGLFPLGAPRGSECDATVSGGSLLAPRHRRILMPGLPGERLDPPPFEGPGGAVSVPFQMVAGDGPEVFETAPPDRGASTPRLPLGGTANGRVEPPGNVDAYEVPVHRGDRIRIRLRAAELGSWLDSVLTVRDSQGRVLAENDDLPTSLWPPGNIPASAGGRLFTDSAIDYEAVADEVLRVEVADRFGDGGPEFAYRLTAGETDADFAVAVRPVPTAETVLDPPSAGAGASGGFAGSVNLVPGSTYSLRVLIAVEGRPGPITVRAEGLPAGVSCRPITVRPRSGQRAIGNSAAPNSTISSGLLTFRVEPDASPALGLVKVSAKAVRGDGVTLVRPGLFSVTQSSIRVVPAGRPVIREMTILPMKVVAVGGNSP